MIKKTNKKNNTEKPVTNSCSGKRPIGPSGDNQQFAVTNCDLKNINIESLIRIVRGQKVMLDSDLAMLYGVSTSRLNEQVKRNINRFPEDFMFQLSKDEWSALRSQIVILEDMKSQNVISNISENQQEGVLMSQIAISRPKDRRGGTQKLPHMFTRNGIGMLSSVLRSETAVEVYIRIMRAFTASQQIMENHGHVCSHKDGSVT